MSDIGYPAESLFDEESTANAERSMLDQLLSDARLYRSSQEYQNLLDFVVRLRNFAPFNTMLFLIDPRTMTVFADRAFHAMN